MHNLAELVGQNARAHRLAAGSTQDETASACRAAGLGRWTQATVAALELGRRDLRLDEALLVSVALRVPLAHLMRADGGETVTVGDAVWPALSAVDVLHALRADDLPPELAGAGSAQRRWDQPGPGATLGDLATSVADAFADRDRLATRKAAHRLGLMPEQVAALAHRLWGHGLEAERELRSPAGASKQVRAGVTRRLIEGQLIPAAHAAGYLTEDD